MKKQPQKLNRRCKEEPIGNFRKLWENTLTKIKKLSGQA